MAQIRVETCDTHFIVEGDGFHSHTDIDRILVTAKNDDNKPKVVASFKANDIIAIGFAENFK